MTLKAQVLADGPLFVDANTFGESVTYIQAGALPATFNAVVLRGDPSRVQSVGGRSYPGLIIKVLIPVASLPRIKERFDTVEIMFRPEDLQPTSFRIMKIVEQDIGMWTLEAEG